MSREAMQLALEALEFEASGWEDVPPITREAITTLRKALETEQEPFCYYDGRNIVGKEYAHHCDVFPLYTHRAAQQPLTDEQFNRIPELSVIPPHHVEMVVRAIEAAHGIQEKNNA